MSLKNIEFVQCVDNGLLHYKQGMELRLFNENSKAAIHTIIEIVREEYPAAYTRLNKLYGSHPHPQYLVARRFAKCNLSLFDSVSDIDGDGKMHLEFVPCPLRGECLDEGVICRPKPNTSFSDRHLEVIGLIAKGLTDVQVGDRLYISPLTVKVHVKAMLKLSGATNRTALVDYCRAKNLI